MQLTELKQNMSILDRMLAKTSADITVDVTASETAQNKLLKKFRQGIINNALLAAVFACLWIGDVTPDKLPNLFKGFISILTAIAAVWYLILFTRLKKIDIARLSPSKLLSATTTIKLLTLSGEVAFGIALAVFFTMLLTEMLATNILAFWLIIATLVIALVWGIVYTVPRYVKLFGDLNSLR